MYRVFIKILIYKSKFPLGPISLFVGKVTKSKGSLALFVF